MGGRTVKFEDRTEAGKQLAGKIPGEWQDASIVFGITFGGTIAALPVANTLKAKLYPAFIAKLPIPWSQDKAFGVVASDGEVVLDEGQYRQIGLSFMDVQKIARTRLAELKRKEANIGIEGGLPKSLKNQSVLLVDDGITTGYTALGAIKWLQKKGAQNIFVASPVAHTTAIDLLKAACSGVLTLISSSNKVFAVSAYYKLFAPVGDKEVRETIKNNRDFLLTVND